MNNLIAIIANRFAGILNRVCEKPVVRIDGVRADDEFDTYVAPTLKQQYLNIVLLDITAIDGDVIQAIRYLKESLVSSVRIIIVAPNLTDEVILQQILVYGIYDIVNPIIDFDSMDDAEIDKKIMNEVQWAIQEPTQFAQVCNKLNINVVQVAGAPEMAPSKVKRPSRRKMNKPRLLGIYSSEEEMFDKITESKKYNVVDIIPASEEQITGQSLEAVDIIALQDVPTETVAYVASLANFNQVKTVITAGYRESDAFEAAKNLKDVNVFKYDGTAVQFARNVSINSVSLNNNSSDMPCRIYGIYGVKGGTGATVITSVLARKYFREHPSKRVLAVDFSTKSGDLAEKFGIAKADPNLFECVASFIKAKQNHLDLDTLKDKILDYCHYTEGVYVLPTSYTDIYRYTDYLVNTREIANVYAFILDTLREYFDAVFIDITKYGGFTFDLAIDAADKIILVGDGKLSSTSQFLSVIDKLDSIDYLSKTYLVVNRCDIRHNSNEYENTLVLENKVGREKVVHLPVDKKLRNEPVEMEVEYGHKFNTAISTVFDAIEALPKPKKKGLFGK